MFHFQWKLIFFFYLPWFCTGIAALGWLLGVHQASILFPLLNNIRKENVMEKLRSWRKNRETTYPLQSLAKQRIFLELISFIVISRVGYRNTTKLRTNSHHPSTSLQAQLHFQLSYLLPMSAAGGQRVGLVSFSAPSFSWSSPAWGVSHSKKAFINFLNIGPSHGLQFLKKCSSSGFLPWGTFLQ